MILLNTDFEDITSVKIKLTNNCNFGCDYCFFKRKSGFISLETIDKLITKIHDIKNLDITLYGGEPLLHNNIVQIVDKLHQYGNIGIETNGFINKNFDKLKDYDIKWSFTYHLNHNDTLTPIINKAKQLKNYEIVFILSKDNQDVVYKKYNILKKYFNCVLTYVFQDLNYINKKYIEHDNNLIYITNNKIYHTDNITMIQNGITDFSGKKCDCGFNHIVLDCDGKIYRCEPYFVNRDSIGTIDTFNFYTYRQKCASKLCTDYWRKISD